MCYWYDCSCYVVVLAKRWMELVLQPNFGTSAINGCPDSISQILRRTGFRGHASWIELSNKSTAVGCVLAELVWRAQSYAFTSRTGRNGFDWESSDCLRCMFSRCNRWISSSRRRWCWELSSDSPAWHEGEIPWNDSPIPFLGKTRYFWSHGMRARTKIIRQVAEPRLPKFSLYLSFNM